jgi:hypothetical protein
MPRISAASSIHGLSRIRDPRKKVVALLERTIVRRFQLAGRWPRLFGRNLKNHGTVAVGGIPTALLCVRTRVLVVYLARLGM